ncbi:MAG: outer membrane lipoprotein-sorting protein [Gammaproteobacteria bacterium]|nr:outer membrane lipoprotein-sorting protein [Gammaproteobacteria bacterium]
MSPVDAANDVRDVREKGHAIAERMHDSDRGWRDLQADMLMILRNAQGQESRRELRVRSLEVADDGDKSLTIFDTPADVRGTAFLSHTHALEPDDQWLYLPALKRVKRIASASKSGPFMGSEFAYEDLTSNEVDKYTYTWLRAELVDGRPVDVIERRPAYDHSGYTRQLVWVDQQLLRPLKVDFYDRKDALLKTLTFHDYQPYLSKPVYRPRVMHMANHQNGKSTELRWLMYRFQTGLDSADFEKNVLRRVR